MRIWITGISGFLGSHLAEELEKLGHKVCGNDNEICSSVTNKYCKTDCRDQEEMAAQLENFDPDVLIHCAATAHEGLSNFSPSFITRNIYEASVAIFSAAIASGVRRIIFMSSMARYGMGGSLYGGADWYGPPFQEGYETNPIDPYGIAKVASEDTLIALCKLHNVEYVIAVPHSIIGARQKYDDSYRNVCSIMINRALRGLPIYIYGDGQQKRSFSPIEDCLDSIIKMIDAPISGEIINIGPDGNEITISEVAYLISKKCKEKTGIEVELVYLNERPNEVKNAWCSSEKAKRLLGYNPIGNLDKCLSGMIDYIIKNGTKEFVYNFPIEIIGGLPKVWAEKML